MVEAWFHYSSDMASVTAFPPAALEWLTGHERTSVLLVGASAAHASALARAGHAITVVDPDRAALVRTRRSWIHVAVARPEALPFSPRSFAVVVAIQNFHTLAPGLALGEWARVLKGDGRIAIAYFSRDDSVPWVKKLKAIVQTRLPDAMATDHGPESVSALHGSVYFPAVETTTFRLWTPSTRAQLQDMVRHAAGADQLDEATMTGLLDEVGALYDEYARAPEPLQLPYRVQCWRAQVDQTHLAAELIPGDHGLSITL